MQQNDQTEEVIEDYTNALRLDQPFYDLNTHGAWELDKTASFGELEIPIQLMWMPSFAKFGLLSGGLKKKLEENKNEAEEKSTEQPEQQHEVGPEYLSIDASQNLPSGFFYLAHEDEKVQFEK